MGEKKWMFGHSFYVKNGRVHFECYECGKSNVKLDHCWGCRAKFCGDCGFVGSTKHFLKYHNTDLQPSGKKRHIRTLDRE